MRALRQGHTLAEVWPYPVQAEGRKPDAFLWAGGRAAPKERARVVLSGGKVRSYTPAGTSAWESIIAAEGYRSRPVPAFAGPVLLWGLFVLPRPGTVPEGTIWMDRRPDRSNLDKAIEDGLNGVWYRDDCLIVANCTAKV